MGDLLQKIKDNSNGNIVDYYKENTMELYNKYKNPDKFVKTISVKNMADSHFYFIHYADDSNWMRYSPIFFVDIKKFEDMIIGYGVNLNFLPLEVRGGFFDKMVDTTGSNVTGVNFDSIYKQLLKIGYEYALVEYDMRRIERSYLIDFSILPEFLYSSYPKNKYDPDKLYSIWAKKLETREQRHQEIIQQLSTDFFKATEEISGKYDQLSGHLNRVKKGHEKYGKN
jgi:hypothetical protein